MAEVVGVPANMMMMHGGHGMMEAMDVLPSEYGDPALAAIEQRKIDFMAADGGSTDPGPHFLGAGKSMTHRLGIKRGFEIYLPVLLKNKIPLIVGSCGLGGAKPQLDFVRGIVEEVAREQNLHFRLGLVESDADRSLIKQRLKEGRVHPLKGAPALRESDIDRSTNIVAMQGTEPIIKALQQGADVVLCGRTSDSALFAAVPIMHGIPLAQAWHMAKVIDHGFMDVDRVSGIASTVYGIARDDHFRVEATHPQGKMSAKKAAQSTVYENASPFQHYQPPGMVDTSEATFDQVDPRTVVIRGSKFVPMKYTVKLEGAELVGYRSITIGGARDPDFIRQIDPFLAGCETAVIKQAMSQGIDPKDFKLIFRVYGKNAVMQDWEPQKMIPGHEVCVIGETVAKTQELAGAIMNMTHCAIMHRRYPGRLHTAGNMGFPFSPSDIDCGPVYQFSVWHTMELDDPLESCRVSVTDL